MCRFVYSFFCSHDLRAHAASKNDAVNPDFNIRFFLLE